MRIDLHIHSTASDGRMRPEVVERARAGGLDIIALADHDTTVGGVPEATTAGRIGRSAGHPRHRDLRPHDGRDLHILGYFIDPAAPRPEGLRVPGPGSPAGTHPQMIDRLAALDVAVEFDAVVAEAGPDVRSLARPHLARVMRAAGHVGSVSEAFDRFIGDDGPAFVAARLLDVPGAIRLIHDAGGIAVWAHPPIALLGRCSRSSWTPASTASNAIARASLSPTSGACCERCDATDLVATGGSDWHGDWHGDLGSFHLQRTQVQEFLERPS
jgi:3',5'-nucleoside bisphosphate phosphatase